MRNGADASLFELWRTEKHDSLHLVPARAYHEDHCWVSLGLRKIFMPLSEEGVQHVMVRNVANYQRDRIFKRVLGAIIGNGLLISEGQEWKAQRKAISHAFTPPAVKEMLGPLTRFLDCILPRLLSCDEALVLHPRLDELAFELATHMLRPSRADAPLEDTNALCLEIRDRLYADIWDAVLPPLLSVPRAAGRRRLGRRLDVFVDRLVAQPPDETGGDMLAQFVAAYGGSNKDSAPGGLRDQLKTFMLAATNTLTDTLHPALALLAQNRALQDWLHARVADKDLSAEGILDSLPRLVEIRAFLREVLRLYPAVPLFWACATADDVIAGHGVKAGTLVLIAPWALHRHHAYWAEPNLFDLRRFLPGAPEPSRSIYVPFGTGPRVCIGQYLALAEATIILAKILARYEIAFADAAGPASSFLKKDRTFVVRLRHTDAAAAATMPILELEEIAA